MKELQVGDLVLTGSKNYEAVYAFGHHKQDGLYSFLQVHTKNEQTPFEVTPEHLVFLSGRMNPVRADSIKVGDELRGATSGARVTKIAHVHKQGLYAPLTAKGSVVVDGIVASSYISLQSSADEYVELQGGFKVMSQHSFVHMTLAPFRFFCMGC